MAVPFPPGRYRTGTVTGRWACQSTAASPSGRLDGSAGTSKRSFSRQDTAVQCAPSFQLRQRGAGRDGVGGALCKDPHAALAGRGQENRCRSAREPLAHPGCCPTTFVSGLCAHSRCHTAMPQSRAAATPSPRARAAVSSADGASSTCARSFQLWSWGDRLVGAWGGPCCGWQAAPRSSPPHPHMMQRGLWRLTGPISEHQHMGE